MSEMLEPADVIPSSLLLRAYEIGIFPMADGDDATKIVWIEPKSRGVITEKSAHIPKRIWQYIRKEQPRIVFNDTDQCVISACARKTTTRQKTWINQTIQQSYRHLFAQGICHTISVYDKNRSLLGGLYGIVIGSVFFGESMVSFAPRASQIALAALLLRMVKAKLTLLDCQFITPHLQNFGCYSLSHQAYLDLLRPHLYCEKAYPFLHGLKEDELLRAAQNPRNICFSIRRN